MGDVFIDGADPEQISYTLERFIDAFFGKSKMSPTKDEYGLYIASAASLRSADLSRQVGAAIFSSQGEIISLGCNEVPKAHGGTYWIDSKDRIYRDIEIGHDPNDIRKQEIMHEIINILQEEGFLSDSVTQIQGVKERTNFVFQNERIQNSQIMDILEFGRIIHAEVSAICDAARLGLHVKGATLFCTTFPCHMCAKHIVASGVTRVVFLEPYPKSYAKRQHEDSISFDKKDSAKVVFEPFLGVAPRRYADLFRKRRRKDQSGMAKEWFYGQPVPMIEDRGAGYVANEGAIFVKTRKGIEKPTDA